MAATNTFSGMPILGADLSNKNPKSSTQGFRVGFVTIGADGHKYAYAKAAGAKGSTARFDIGDGGTLTTSATGGYICNVGGGVVAGQFFWARGFAM